MDIDKAYELINAKLLLWLREFVRLLPNLAIAALVLVLGIYLARIARNITTVVSKRIIHHQVLNSLFANFVHVLGIGITIFIVLSILNLDKAVTSLLAGAGIVGLALAFAFQDIAANFVAGIVMSFTRPIEIGDLVKVKDYMGTVESIRLRDSIIRTFQGQTVYIPNKEIFQNPIENFTKFKKRRLDLLVGVSYGDDLEKVKKVALAAVQSVSHRSEKDPVELFYEEFSDSSINFSLRIWLNSTQQPVYLEARSQAVMFIKTAFDANNITIPFPIRTLDFGIKGGEKLSDTFLNIKSDTND
ncbi:mechanosensitive ion channel family protein [Desertivirga brevis]|uniref:mechanosensitive ion channel family protein n=1 Tax=Desertivirga brevis TaxID=2810310 RepID=UPI001A956FB2|nr:mechanosensitive ion channel family protein [Pedobacter sp. SYSU D00873]